MIIRRENIQITIVQWRINILLGVESTTTKNHWHKIYWNKFKLSLHTLIICNKVTNNQSVAFICQIFTKINKQVGIHQTKNLLHSKRNNQQNEWDNMHCVSCWDPGWRGSCYLSMMFLWRMIRVKEGDGLLQEKGNLSLPSMEIIWSNQVSLKGNRVREKEWIFAEQYYSLLSYVSFLSCIQLFLQPHEL